MSARFPQNSLGPEIHYGGFPQAFDHIDFLSVGRRKLAHVIDSWGGSVAVRFARCDFVRAARGVRCWMLSVWFERPRDRRLGDTLRGLTGGAGGSCDLVLGEASAGGLAHRFRGALRLSGRRHARSGGVSPHGEGGDPVRRRRCRVLPPRPAADAAFRGPREPAGLPAAREATGLPIAGLSYRDPERRGGAARRGPDPRRRRPVAGPDPAIPRLEATRPATLDGASPPRGAS